MLRLSRGSNTESKHAREHRARGPRARNELRLDSNNFGHSVCTGIRTVSSYKQEKCGPIEFQLSACLHTYCHLSINEKPRRDLFLQTPAKEQPVVTVV